ncbi:hypothetical protein ACLESD_28525 [Pyxidicoccus sp. 3LFB2]
MSSIKGEVASDEGVQAVLKKANARIAPLAPKWVLDSDLKSEGAWSTKASEELLRWARSLGLLEEGWNVSELGDIWVHVWGGSNLWQKNPLRADTPERRMVAWNTLLAADGLLILACWDCLSSVPKSLAQVGQELGAKLKKLRPPKTADASVGLVQVRLRESKTNEAVRNVLSSRIVPLIDLGVAKAPKRGFYSLTDFGLSLKSDVREWLADEELLSVIHRRKSWLLSSRGLGLRTLPQPVLHESIARLLQVSGEECWGKRRQWPLWETLLLGACYASRQRGAGFELSDAHVALEKIRAENPGSIEWVPGRQMDQIYFRISEAVAMPSLRGNESHDSQKLPEQPSSVAAPVVGAVASPAPALILNALGVVATPVVSEPTSSEYVQQAEKPVASSSPPLASPAYPLSWLRDMLEDHLLLEEDRPVGMPLLGAYTSVEHLISRLQGLEREPLSEHDSRFWNKLDQGSEIFIQGKEGPYGVLLNHLRAAIGNDVHSVASLFRKLTKHKSENDEHGRLWCAQTRLTEASADIKAAASHFAMRLRTPGKEPPYEVARLLVRDAVNVGRLNNADIVKAIAPSDDSASVEGVIGLVAFETPVVAYNVTLEIETPSALIAAIGKSDTQRLSFARARSSGQREELEISIPPKSHLGAQDLDIGMTAVATVFAPERQAAMRFAADWAQGLVDQFYLAFVSDAAGGPSSAPSVEERRLLQVHAVDAVLTDGAATPGDTGVQGKVEGPHLRLWQPQIDDGLANLLRTSLEPLPAEHSQYRERIVRSLAWWKRATEASDPILRFSCLWSGMEHLLAPTRGLLFTRKLAGAITLPLLRRRCASLVREIAQRLLRVVAWSKPESQDGEAKAIYEIVQDFCLSLEEAQRLQRELPVEVLRGERRDSQLRHVSLKTVSAYEFVQRIRKDQAGQRRLSDALQKHAPYLATILDVWLGAVRERKKLLALIVGEHDKIVAQYSVCYDFRNRIQHDGDYFPGAGRYMLEQASHYLRAWLRVLLDALMRSPVGHGEPLGRKLRLRLDDLYDQLIEVKDKGLSEPELGMLLQD